MLTEVTLLSLLFNLSRWWDLNPRTPDWKSGAIDRYATSANTKAFLNRSFHGKPARAIDRVRTCDPRLGKTVLYQLSYYRINKRKE